MKFLGIYPFKLYSHRQNDLTDCFSFLKTIVPYSEMTKGSKGLHRETLRQYSGACFNTLKAMGSRVTQQPIALTNTLKNCPQSTFSLKT